MYKLIKTKKITEIEIFSDEVSEPEETYGNFYVIVKPTNMGEWLWSQGIIGTEEYKKDLKFIGDDYEEYEADNVTIKYTDDGIEPNCEW